MAHLTDSLYVLTPRARRYSHLDAKSGHFVQTGRVGQEAILPAIFTYERIVVLLRFCQT